MTLGRLASDPALPLPLLFSYNRRQLDAYQEESRNQQRAAFRQAQIASIAGLVLLAAGIAAVVLGSTGIDKYVVAALSGMGAAASGYVANTSSEPPSRPTTGSTSTTASLT